MACSYTTKLEKGEKELKRTKKQGKKALASVV
jgi:hypothetical protein